MNRALTLYPAIDLKSGVCVRLLYGRMDQATVYNKDPVSQAEIFVENGFSWVHIVDLDGAFSGKSENRPMAEAIIANTVLKAQLGGGIRDMASVELWLDLGMSRIILGTAAVRDVEFVKSACRAFPGQVVVGIDARDGRVKTDGWDGDTGHTPQEIAKRYEDEGVAEIIYTDIGRDGALAGVNVEATAALADAVAIPVIASGGVASVKDIELLASAHDNIEGVIIGRALYDGRIDPAAALKAANPAK